MNSIICTIASGTYHWGGAALINSLVSSGFKGKLFYIYGDPVLWAPNHDLSKPLNIEGIDIIFEKIAPKTNPFAYKPKLILDLLERGDNAQVFYFDCDIVVKAPWSEMELWATGGIALCQDFHLGDMPHNHIRRKSWKRWLEQNDISLKLNQKQDRYYNAGFLSANKNNRAFLETWETICGKIFSQTSNRKDHLPILEGQPHNYHFNSLYFYDQDAMNMALMAVEDEINYFDYKGMDTNYWGPYMSHALGPLKPWCGNFIKRVFQNNPPLYPDIAFSMYMNGPIPVFSKLKRVLFKAELKIATILAKVLGRSKI